MVGHNWSIFLDFNGGRGLSPFIGALLVIFPLGCLWIAVFLIVGFVLGDSAPWALASLIFLPLLVGWKGAEPVVDWAALGMVLVTLAKRLEANRRSLPEGRGERWKVIVLRLLFDRDIASHKEWINRIPD